MWSICTSHVINMHQSCDQYAPVMWLICTSHVIDMHQSCDQYAPVMWLICTSRVINMHQSCDQYAPVMWSISTSHVIDRHQSCDQYAPVVWSICAIWPTVWSRDGHSYVTQGCLKPGKYMSFMCGLIYLSGDYMQCANLYNCFNNLLLVSVVKAKSCDYKALLV